MKKMRTSVITRFIAGIFAILFGLSTVLGLAAIIYMNEVGVYAKSYEEVLSEARQRALKISALKIFENRDNPDVMENTNLEYGIIKTNLPEGVDKSKIDITSESLYYYKNFSTTNPTKDSYKIALNEDAYTNYDTSAFWSLTGSGMAIGYYDTPTKSTESEKVQGVVYDTATKYFYYETKSYYFPIKVMTLQKSGKSKKNTDFKYSEYVKGYVSDNNGKTHLTDYKKWENIILYKNWKIKVKNIKQINTLQNLNGKIVRTIDDVWSVFDESTIGKKVKKSNSAEAHYISFDVANSDTYIVVCNFSSYFQDKIKVKMHDDIFTQQENILKTMYKMRYSAIVLTIISGLVCLMFVAFCCYSAGVEEDLDSKTGIKYHYSWRYRIPLELYALYIFIAAYFSVEIAFSWTPRELISSVFIMCTLACDMAIGLLALMNICARSRSRLLFRNTITYHILHFCKRVFMSLIKNMSLFFKGGIVFGVLSIVEFFVLVIYNDRPGTQLTLWLFYKIIIAAVLILAFSQMNQLKKAGINMAQGDLDNKIDTEHMMWEFKKHGENLNQLHDGITIALNERMKSEHFKTELITNVSHDIKTPLTSIINYIDLLQKDGVTEEEKKEYLEVLTRQSSRLKKLIDDLIEASKASTGNLEVQWEKCDVDILLTQTLGEFEEKFNSSNLELIIKKCEQPAIISADNRHIWRIFDNLMNNICKYAQPGTRVYVNQEIDNGKVSIIFKNTSKYPLNISSEELMERFVRGDGSRNTEGSGLGLSIAKNLTELMNGDFKIYIDGDLFKVVLKFDILQK